MDLFSEPSPLRASLDSLAKEGILIGTSSWKYPGWLGQIYSEGRYLTRGKLSNAKFEANCLTEYAETFSTVCVDAGYYTFPSVKYLEGLASQVPAHFRFAFEATDEITVKRFPKRPRFGPRGGTDNANFLDADLFQRAFLAPALRVICSVHRYSLSLPTRRILNGPNLHALSRI